MQLCFLYNYYQYTQFMDYLYYLVLAILLKQMWEKSEFITINYRQMISYKIHEVLAQQLQVISTILLYSNIIKFKQIIAQPISYKKVYFQEQNPFEQQYIQSQLQTQSNHYRMQVESRYEKYTNPNSTRYESTSNQNQSRHPSRKLSISSQMNTMEPISAENNKIKMQQTRYHPSYNAAHNNTSTPKTNPQSHNRQPSIPKNLNIQPPNPTQKTNPSLFPTQHSQLELQPLFTKSGVLSPSCYLSFSKIAAGLSSVKGLMHIGVCLEIEQIMSMIKTLFVQTNRSVVYLARFGEKLRTQGVYFVPGWAHRVEGCVIVYWFMDSSLLRASQRSRQMQKWIHIFTQFPQVIISTPSSFQTLQSYRLHNYKTLFGNYQQYSYIIKQLKHKNQKQRKSKDNFYSMLTTNSLQPPTALSSSKDSYYIQALQGQNNVTYFDSFDRKVFQGLLINAMKKNSQRCQQQLCKINLYILQSLASNLLKISDISPRNSGANVNPQTKPQFFLQILDIAASNYLFIELQKSFQQTLQSLKSSFPIPQKELQTHLSQLQQQFIRELKTNIKLLNQQQKQRQLIQTTEKKLQLSLMELIAFNKEAVKKQNGELINDLYEKLLSQFDKGKYIGETGGSGIKNNNMSKLMVNDLQTLMEDYEKKGVKSSSLFWVFNTFMQNNKHRYYQKIHQLQQQIDESKKLTNFDQIFDKIQFKKKYLATLERSVKQLQIKKKQIELQNQRLKSLQKQLNQRVHIQSQADQLAEGESFKASKKSLSPRGKMKKVNTKGTDKGVFQIAGKEKGKNKDRQAKGWKNCCACKCAIF